MAFRPHLPLAALLLLAGCAHDGDPDRLAGGWESRTETVEVVEVPVEQASVKDAWADSVVPGLAVHLSHPRAVAESDGPYLLDTGDRLRVFVYGQPNLSRLYTVDHDGRIVIPLIGSVLARGRTVYDLAAVVRDRLGAKYVRDPQVTIDVAENRPFFILGEVRNAGQFPYVSGMTVETAAAIAGGFSERADERRVRITRRINGVVEVIQAPTDYVVKPGDTIYVNERYF